MMMKFTLSFTLLFISAFAFSQSNALWDDTKVNSVYIYLPQDSLDWIYNNVDNDHKFPALFIYEYGAKRDSLNIGFRLRGNTSRQSAKKSFKIDFNEFVSGQTYFGEKEINLNGSHNDPSMIREKLFYDVWKRLGFPERKTAFVKVYINDNYYGLYINMQEYDAPFLQNQLGNSTGNLYKCTYPSDLKYLGDNQNSYKSIMSGNDRAYDLKTNESLDDYSDLINLTRVVEQTALINLACELEKIFDVDSYLKAHALDVSTGNWDNYSYNKNNYYLYHNPATGKFIYLAYDCDNTFGVDWVNKNWGTRNIYTWNDDEYPLTEKIMQVPKYKDRFSYYINQIVNGVLKPENINPRIDSLKNLIDAAAYDDLYRTYDYNYTYENFIESFNTNDIDGHTPYGVKNFIATRRANTLSQLDLNNIYPVIRDEGLNPKFPAVGLLQYITAKVYDDNSLQNVTLHYSYDSVQWNVSAMFDDGNNRDGIAGDKIFGAPVPVDNPGKIWYYITATDNASLTNGYPLCGTIEVSILPSATTGVIINEFMAQNTKTITDAEGKFEDWVELFNPTANAVYLGDKYMTDNFDEPGKWQLPDTTLLPGEYLLIWADEDLDQGPTHGDFKLSTGGERVGLFTIDNGNYIPLDTITFGQQKPDTTTGRLPNGTGAFVIMLPTPNAINQGFMGISKIALNNANITLAGNPSSGFSELKVELPEAAHLKVSIFTIDGRQVSVLSNHLYNKGKYVIPVDCSSLSKGTYIVNVQVNGKPTNLRLILL